MQKVLGRKESQRVREDFLIRWGLWMGMQLNPLMWTLLQKAGRLLQTHPGCWSKQSTLKSPCEASDRINHLTRRWIQEGRMSERHTSKGGTVSWKFEFYKIVLIKLGESHKDLPEKRHFSIHMLFVLPTCCAQLRVYIQPIHSSPWKTHTF